MGRVSLGLRFVIGDGRVCVFVGAVFVVGLVGEGVCGVLEVVGQGHVAGGAEAADVCAVFVLDAEDGPDAAADDFGEGDEEGNHGRVLDVVGVDGVEDPVEAEDGVDEHGAVVPPGGLVGEGLTQQEVFGVGIQEGPVHYYIPDAGVDAVDGGAEDEEGFHLVGLVDAEEGE